MSLLRRFLSQDNLSKYEKEQKKRYKQYVKLGISNTIVSSKTEPEIYQDYFVRKKSIRRSKKKFSIPKKEDKHNDIFKEPSTSGTLTVAPAVLDAVNKNVTINNMPVEYLTDLKQMEVIEVNVDTSNIQIQESNTNPIQLNDPKIIHTQEPVMNSTQSNLFKPVQIEQEKKTSIDLGNTQPLEQKFSYGNQETFLNQLDEVIKNRNRNQPSPSVSETSQTHTYENQPAPRPNKKTPIAKPRKKATKTMSEDSSSVNGMPIVFQQVERAQETNVNQQDDLEYQHQFVPIEVQEKLDLSQAVSNQNFVPIKAEEEHGIVKKVTNHNQRESANIDENESEKEISTLGLEDQVDGAQEILNHKQQGSVYFDQDEGGKIEVIIDEIPESNRKERKDSENYYSEYEELVWDTPPSNLTSPVSRSESRLTTQSDDSFFDCISDNADIYGDEEKNIMRQISPHFHKNKFPYSDTSETDSKSIDSENVLDQDKQISLHIYGKDISVNDNLGMDSNNIDSENIFVQEEEISPKLNEKEFTHENTHKTEIIITDYENVEQVPDEQNLPTLNNHRVRQKQDLLMDVGSLTVNDNRHLNIDLENNIEPDSLEVPTEPTPENSYIETQNDYIVTNWAETKQVKESDFASKTESKDKLREIEETQTQNEALLLDENYRPPQSISNFRYDPEFLIPYNQKSNRNHLIKLENNNDYENVESHPDKHEGKKVTFDFGKSYCQTYEVDNSPENSELIDSTLISALTKEEGQVFMPADNELYMKMQQSGRNKLKLNTHRQESLELPEDERSQVYQSYGIQLTPEEELIDKIFENSKNMDVAFLNCVEGFDLKIQNRNESPNTVNTTNLKNEEDIRNRSERTSDTDANKNLSNPNIKNDIVEEPIVQSPTLNNQLPDNEDISNSEEHVGSLIINEEDQKAEINNVSSIDNKMAHFKQNNEVNSTVNGSYKENTINKMFIDDQTQDSIQLIDFAEDTNAETQTENGRESPMQVSNRQILDNFTLTASNDLNPANVNNDVSVRRGIIEKDSKEFHEPRPTSNDLFNEFHISLEKYDNGQEDILYQRKTSIQSNKNNEFNGIALNTETNISEEIAPINDHPNKIEVKLIPLEYLAEDYDTNPNESEIILDNNGSDDTKQLTILKSTLEKQHTINDAEADYIESYTLKNTENLLKSTLTSPIEQEEEKAPMKDQDTTRNEDNDEDEKTTKLLTILESPLEKQLNDTEANHIENYTLKITENLLKSTLTSPIEEKEVEEAPMKDEDTTRNEDNDEDQKTANEDVDSLQIINNKTPIIEEPLANKKNTPTSVYNENNDVEVIISKSTPVSPMNKYVPQSPLRSGYVPGRKSIDFSKGIAPKPDHSKFLNRSVSHNFFPASRIRPKPVYFERFKRILPPQEDENDTINNNDPRPSTTENIGETVVEIQNRLTQVSKMDDAGEQLAAMQDIVVSLKRKADALNSRTDVEYLPLLQSLFKSVRVVSAFQCNFDEKLLMSQQKTLKDVKKCISELSLK